MIRKAQKITALLLSLFAVLNAAVKRLDVMLTGFQQDTITAENAGTVLNQLRKTMKNDVYKYIVPTI